MSAYGGFELEPDPVEDPKRAPEPRPNPIPFPGHASASKPAANPAKAPEPETGLLARVEPIVRKRMKRMVPIFAVVFLIIGYFFVGVGLWAFVLVGAGVGVFAAYRRTEEYVLGSISGAAGYLATGLAIHALPIGFGLIFVVGLCGGAGALMAIDDRLG